MTDHVENGLLPLSSEIVRNSPPAEDFDDVALFENSINKNSPVIVRRQATIHEDAPSRRRHQRSPAQWPITAYKASRRKDGQWKKSHFNAMSEDVSKSGIGFVTNAKLKQDDLCVITVKSFVNGKSRNLTLAVKVKFVALSGDKFRCGAEFININKSNANFIQSYIRGKSRIAENFL